MAVRPTHDGRQTRRGTAALEFVIVLPVLMLIVLAATDLSRALYFDNVLCNAARAGAAWGATHQATDYTRGDWESNVESHIAEEAANLPDFDPDRLVVTVTETTEVDGSTRVRVEAAYPFELMIAWPGWPPELALERSVSMRRYR